MKSRTQIILIGILIILSFFCCSKKEQDQKNVVIRIGDELLTLEYLKQEIPIKYQNTITREQVLNFLQRWMENELIAQEGYRRGLDKSPELTIALKKAEKEFLVNKVLSSLIAEEVTITDQEVINYYEQNENNYIRANDEIRALHILVADENYADEIYKRISRGEDFEEIAKEVSLDYSRRNRIDMGYFSADDVVPEIAQRIFNWKTGTVTQPIKSEFGYHIFKILDRQYPETVREFEDVKDEIKNILMAEKRKEIYQNFVTNLKSNVEIVTNYELLNELMKTKESLNENHMEIANYDTSTISE